MTDMSLTFDAVSEASPGPKWAARWARSWPAYEPWFVARGGDNGPSRAVCRAALERHMPELVPTYDRLVTLAGGGDRAARFLSTWCPPQYLGGCSLAAVSDGTDVRLVRNYDLSPNLNEGLMLQTAWTGRRVMGMVEFLWGLSDGINDAGLSIALAYGGRTQTGRGFGITTILRYVMETCDTVDQALAVLDRVPSHMAYNVVIADAGANTTSVELSPGGGARRMPQAIAMECALTGRMIPATEAERWGLVNRLCAPGTALDTARALAAEIARNAPLSLIATKDIVAHAGRWSEEDLWTRPNAILERIIASDDAREGAVAFAEKRPPVWEGR